MASKHTGVSGSYEKKVEDSGDGCGLGAQSKAKFGNPITHPKDSSPAPHQTLNKPTDSKDSKI